MNPRLTVDSGALFESTAGGDFFFKKGAIASLLEFSQQSYRISLLTQSTDSQRLLSWGKKFLFQEKIGVTLLPLSSFKKTWESRKLIPGSLYALTPIVCKSLSLTHNLSAKNNKNALLFFSCPNSLTIVNPPQALSCRDWATFTQAILHPSRQAEVSRKTAETDIQIWLDLDGRGRAKIKTGLGFFDHMLTNFCKHSGIDMNLTVKGDLEVDEHHTIEDTALALGEAIRKALGDKKGLERYGFVLPMDESEASCSIDFSGRSHLEWNCIPFKREYVGDFPTEMLQHFYNSFCLAAGLNMNMKITGKNEHHLIESSFKSFARCLRQALRVTGKDIPSTKGSL